MPIFLFVIALAAVDLAAYGLLYTVHAMLVKGFAFSEAAQSGGMQIAGRLWYLQFPLQIVALGVAFKIMRTPRYVVAILCAVVPLLVVVMIFRSPGLFSLWQIFVPNPLAWNLAEGFVLVLSVTVAWLATASIRPRQGQVIVASE